MKTNNTIVSSIMRYICAIILLVIGTSISAWATTITLKVWDSTNEVYVTWGTFEKGNEPGYGPTDGGWYYNVAWAPGEQEQSHSNYSKNFPTNGGLDNGSTWFNQYAFPTSDYDGEATTLYAVYDDGYNYTTRPYMTFADLAGCSTAPTVTAGSNSSVASTSATVSCSSGISALGDCGITSYGFVYGTSSNPTTSNSIAQVGTSYTSTGTSFSTSLTGLNASTTYYVRPYATNGNGTSYGAQTSFTTKPQYTISYNNNGGSGSISSQTKDYDVSLTLNGGGNFSKTGYSLSKWHTNADGTSGSDYALGGSYTANAGATMYAIWTPEEYTITLNNQGATSGGSSSITVTYGESTNLTGEPAITAPTKTGYTFGGYYTETGGNGGQVIAANGNVVAEANDGVSEYYTDEDKKWIYANGLTLYAKWTANTIELTLDKNGVTGTDGSATITFGGDAVNSSPTHAVNSDGTYSLAGYYSENTCAAANKVLDATGNVVNATVSGYITSGVWTRATTPTTLYAKWSKDVYAVTFDMQGHGDDIDAQEVESGAKVIEPEAPIAEDYRFKGWYKEDTYTNEWDFDNDVVSSVTVLYAKWEDVTYSETLKAWCDPDIDITGNIYLTSTNGIPVYSTSTTSNLLGIKSEDLSGVTKLEIKYLDADNGDAEVANASSLFRLCNNGTVNYNTADGSQIDVSASNTCDLSYSIRYTPSAHNVINHYKLQITMKRGTRAVKTVTKDLYGRSLPEEFVIAAKNNNDNQWYALPNTIVDNNNAISPTRITVDNTTTPTKASYAPNTTVYKGAGRYASGTNVYGIGFTTDGTDQFKIRKNSNYVYLSTTGSSKYQDFYLASTNGATFGAYNITVPSDDSDDSGKELGIKNNNFGYFKDATVDAVYILPIENKMEDNDAIVTEWGKMSVILDVDAQSASSAQARLGAGDPEKVVTFGQTRTSVAGSASKYNYTLRFSTLDFSAHKGELLYIDWLDEGDNVLSTSAITIPWIIASSGKMSSIDGTKSHWTNEEVHVLPGVVLEADAGEFESRNVAIKTLEVYQGATVNITKGTKADGTLNVTNLVLRNGWTRAGSKEYNVARVYINSDNASLAASNVYADWYIDFDQYYPIAVPWNVTVANMSYKNTTGAVSVGPGNSNTVRLRYYDGNSRATNIQEGVGSGANWKQYGAAGCTAVPETLTPSTGYAMTARRPTGKAFSIIRMPLTLPSGTWAEGSWTTNGESGVVSETHKDQVSVTAYGVHEESETHYAEGWNLIANPYMSLHQGALTYNDGSGDVIEYANVPDINFKEYDQLPIETTKLKPASAFLVQVPKTGTVTFGTANRKASAPSYRTEEAPKASKQKAYILLSDEEANDMMGLIISDQYTAEYEMNADLEKLLGDGTSLRTYMRYGDRNMAYVAINEMLAKEWIPVTVRIPENGEYTFSLHEASIAGELEGVYLIDYQNGDQVTNLIEESYSFVTEAGTISNRFAINAIVGKHDTPTSIDIINAGGDIHSDKPVKFIYRDKVYILNRGVIYDSTGKKVREINK